MKSNRPQINHPEGCEVNHVGSVVDWMGFRNHHHGRQLNKVHFVAIWPMMARSRARRQPQHGRSVVNWGMLSRFNLKRRRAHLVGNYLPLLPIGGGSRAVWCSFMAFSFIYWAYYRFATAISAQMQSMNEIYVWWR